jgi:putative transposase
MQIFKKTKKKKHHGGSTEFTKSAFRWKDGQMFWLNARNHFVWSRELPSGCEPSTVTVKLSASGQWHVSLLVNADIEQLPKIDKAIGLDVGITSLIATSDGE